MDFMASWPIDSGWAQKSRKTPQGIPSTQHDETFLNFRNFVMDKALKKFVCKACIICMEKDDAHWT
jgi:hypothetical protein